MHAVCYFTKQLFELTAIDKPSESGSNNEMNESILEEVIEITQRPFGVQFSVNDENGILIIDELIPNSLAEKADLQTGDKLIKINNTCINSNQMTASKAIRIFRETPLPFLATFEKSLSNILSDTLLGSNPVVVADSDDDTNVDAAVHSNENNAIPSALKRALEISVDLPPASSNGYSMFDDPPSVPFSPQNSESDDDALSLLKLEEDIVVFQHDEPDQEEENMDHELSETASVCSFGFADKLCDERSFASSSQETQISDDKQQSIQLLKDLLSESDKARRLNILAKHDEVEEEDIDFQPTASSHSLSFSGSMENKSEETDPSQTKERLKQFIQNFLWMDVQRVFDQYIFHPLNINHTSPVIKSSPQTKSRLRLKLAQMSHSTNFNERRAFVDKQSDWMCSEEQVVAIMTSNGFSDGFHQWSLKILQCDIYRQEIGVISTNNIESKRVDVNGIKETPAFGARAVYGNELLTDSIYHASYNEDNSQRCYKDLSKSSKIGWCTGDVIKVSLDLKTWKIKFHRNNKKVKKTISLQPGRVYYPIFAFSGHCRYELLEFK